MKSLETISDEWLDAIYWSSILRQISMIKYATLSFIVFGTLK